MRVGKCQLPACARTTAHHQARRFRGTYSLANTYSMSLGERRSPENSVVQTLSVGPLSLFGSIAPALLIAVGIAAMFGGTWGLIKPWGVDNPRSGFAFMLTWGLFAFSLGALQILVVARHVDQLHDGRYRFRSHVRNVDVHPMEMISMVGVPRYLDLYGGYPFRMKSSRGSILVDRHMPGGLELEATLRQANPRLRIGRAWDLGATPAWPPGSGGQRAERDVSNIGPR